VRLKWPPQKGVFGTPYRHANKALAVRANNRTEGNEGNEEGKTPSFSSFPSVQRNLLWRRSQFETGFLYGTNILHEKEPLPRLIGTPTRRIALVQNNRTEGNEGNEEGQKPSFSSFTSVQKNLLWRRFQ
jgi:hypothetical protein